MDCKDITCLQSPLLGKISGVKHGFFGMNGGVSEGDFSSLNGSQKEEENKEHVMENRRRVLSYLDISEQTPFFFLNQKHTSDVIAVNKEDAFLRGVSGDSLVTRVPQKALGVLTADCAPVLWVDLAKNLVAATHAGWRGALGGVLENTFDRLCFFGASPETLSVAIGPTIEQDSYEVDQDFHALFLRKNPSYEIFFKPSENEKHFLFDLPYFVEHTLKSLGIQHVDNMGVNTHTGSFFSRRRALKEGKRYHGCGMSLIVLE